MIGCINSFLCRKERGGGLIAEIGVGVQVIFL